MTKMLLRIVVAVLVAAFLTGISLAEVQTMTLIMLTKEKTVFVNDKELIGLIDLTHKVTKNATIVSSTETPIVSYKGTLIEGKIVVKAPYAAFDEGQKKGTRFMVKYVLSKDKKITEYKFNNVTITGVKSDKKDKTGKRTYDFKAEGLIQAQR